MSDLSLKISFLAIDNLSKPFQNLTKLSQKLNLQTKTTQATLRGYNKNQKDIDKLKTHLEKLGQTADSLKFKQDKFNALNENAIKYKNNIADLTLESSDLKKSQKSLKKELASVEKSLKKNYSLDKLQQAENYRKQIDDNKKAIEKNNKALKRNQNRLDKNKLRQQASAVAIEKTTLKQSKQAEVIKKLEENIKNAGGDLNNLSKYENSLKNSTEQANKVLEKQKDKLEKLNEIKLKNKKLDNLKNSFNKKVDNASNVARKAGAGGVVVGGAIIGAVKKFANVEEAMLGVAKQYDGLINSDNSKTEKYNKTLELALRLGQNSALNNTQIIELMEAAGRSKIPFDELEKFVSKTMQQASAFDAQDVNEFGRVFGRVKANWHLNIDGASDLADSVNFLDDNTIATGSGILQFLNDTAGGSSSTSLTAKEAAAFGTTMQSAGTDISTSGQAFTNANTRLGSAGVLPEVKKGLEALSLNAEEIQKGMAYNTAETYLKIFDKFKTIKKEDQLGVLKQIFGGNYNKVFAGVINNLDKLKENLELSTGTASKGSVGKESEKRNALVNTRFNILKNNVEGLILNTIKDYFGGVAELIDKINNIVTVTKKWISENKELVLTSVKFLSIAATISVTIGALSFVFSPLIKLLFKTGVGIAKLKNRFATIKTTGASAGINSFSRATATAGTVARTAAPKLGILSTSFKLLSRSIPFIGWALLAADFFSLLYEKSAWFRSIIDPMIEQLKKLLNDPLGEITRTFNTAIEFIQNKFSGIIGWFTEKLDFIKEQFKKVKDLFSFDLDFSFGTYNPPVLDQNLKTTIENTKPIATDKKHKQKIEQSKNYNDNKKIDITVNANTNANPKEIASLITQALNGMKPSYSFDD